MPEATLKLVAGMAGVAPVTVSRVVNGAENVAAATREKILAIIRDLGYAPNIHAANLRRRSSNGKTTSASKERLVCANQSLSAGCNSCRNVSCPPEEVFIFNAEEYKAMTQQIIQLRRDLDRLRKHTERIQFCVDVIQDAYTRRLSSCAAQ